MLRKSLIGLGLVLLLCSCEQKSDTVLKPRTSANRQDIARLGNYELGKRLSNKELEQFTRHFGTGDEKNHTKPISCTINGHEYDNCALSVSTAKNNEIVFVRLDIVDLSKSDSHYLGSLWI